jgi:hypothetical protein
MARTTSHTEGLSKQKGPNQKTMAFCHGVFRRGESPHVAGGTPPTSRAKQSLKINTAATPSGEEYSRVFRWKRGVMARNYKRGNKVTQKAREIPGVV